MPDIPATKFPALGNKDIHYHLGWEVNELTRTFYCSDTSKLPAIFTKLLGDPYTGKLPHQHPAPFINFYCVDLDVQPVDKKSVQGSVYDFTTLNTFFDQLETVRGGVNIVATYRPWANEGNLNTITDEQFDISAQTMSLIGNNYAQDPQNALHWEHKDAQGKPALVTNLKAIVKLLPKIDLMQKRVFLNRVPITLPLGQTNIADFSFTPAGNNALQVWPAQTLLLMSCPTQRRLWWDGGFATEITIKMAANIFFDTVAIVGYSGAPAPGLKDYVTWNRLYNAQLGYWEKVFVGQNNSPLYPATDFSVLNAISP